MRSIRSLSSNPVAMEKHNIRGFVSCPDASCLSFLFFFSICSCCWICPPFRWLVAMLLSSLFSLALWWIVYGFPSSILHFCIDGLGFLWALPPVSPPKNLSRPSFWSSIWKCCKWAPGLFLIPSPSFHENHCLFFFLLFFLKSCFLCKRANLKTMSLVKNPYMPWLFHCFVWFFSRAFLFPCHL